MTGLLARAAAIFVAPASPAPASARRFAPAAMTGAVLARPRLLQAAAGIVAADLLSRCDARTAVVAVWAMAEDDARPSLALPAARRLAARLAARDLAATATGRLCRAVLDEEPALAALQARRLLGAVDVPVILALARRDPLLDEVMQELDLVVAVVTPDDDEALTEVLVADLVPATRGRAESLPLAPGPLARALAARGWSPARRAMELPA